MIRLTFYILLAIMIAVGAAWISSNPGDVLISWQGWEIRFSVAVLVFLSFLYTAFIFAIIRLLKWLNFSRYFSSPERLAAKRTKAGQDLDQAWSSYALGDYADAIKFGLRAKAKLGEDHNVLRLLASATRMLGEDKNPYLDALKKSDLSTTWVDKQELDDLISLKSWNRAKPLIARMLQHHPKNGQLLLLDFICNTHLNRWKEAKSALETLSKNKGSIDPIRLKRYSAVIDYCLALEAKAAGLKSESHSLLKAALKSDPTYSAAALAYARGFIEQDDKKSAEKVVFQAWKYGPTDELGELFTELYPLESNSETYRRVKRLIEENPSEPESRHLLAGSAINAQKWPDARQALNDLINSKRASKKTYHLLALLERRQKNDLKASEEFSAKAEKAVMDPTWGCTTCNAIPAHYNPHCSNCGDFDSIRWSNS